jgi:hypothetical protein
VLNQLSAWGISRRENQASEVLAEQVRDVVRKAGGAKKTVDIKRGGKIKRRNGSED